MSADIFVTLGVKAHLGRPIITGGEIDELDIIAEVTPAGIILGQTITLGEGARKAEVDPWVTAPSRAEVFRFTQHLVKEVTLIKHRAWAWIILEI